MKNKILLIMMLDLVAPSCWANLEPLPEYGYPECHVCYEQQQWCYEMENRKNCTDDILQCVKVRCTHYKRNLSDWHIL